jgi:DNA-binding Xre family transcriptional regulator
MAVKLKIRDICEQLGIENAGQLAALTEIGRTSAYQIWSGKVKRIDLETIYLLCKGLGTQPAALFDFTPEPESKVGPSLVERIRKVQQVKRGRPRKSKGESKAARPHQKSHPVATGRR